MTYEEMMSLVKGFLHDVYPGAKDFPKSFATMLKTDNPKGVVQDEAVLLQSNKEKCDETTNQNILNNLNKQLNNDFCPDGFAKWENIGCVMVIDSKMTYNEASGYCNGFEGASILQIGSYDDIKTLNEHKILGNYKYTHMIR